MREEKQEFTYNLGGRNNGEGDRFGRGRIVAERGQGVARFGSTGRGGPRVARGSVRHPDSAGSCQRRRDADVLRYCPGRGRGLAERARRSVGISALIAFPREAGQTKHFNKGGSWARFLAP